MMPDKMEECLSRLLGGLHLDDITPELCDFTIEEQNSASEAQGIQPTAASDFIPVLGKNITYIVACVLINDANQVLMMQEAKKSCAGKWYLPAGRMEQGESICDAAVREVYEETGLNVEVTTLLAVESATGSWFRFVLTGRVTGGEIKTPSRADQESLQAKWISDVSEVSLRANDIVGLIEIAKQYKNRGSNPWHGQILPTKFSQHKNYLRVVVAIRKRATNNLHILLSERNSYHFPTVEIHPGRSLHSTLRKFMIELFGADLPQHRPHGILTVEHSPAAPPHTTDGICITLLVAFRPALEEVSLIGKCVWHELSADIGDQLGRILANKNMSIPLHVIR